VLGKVNVTMAVTVNPNGQLSELFVVQSSGIPAYDQEALQTIRESSPFSAPPKNVVDKDGMLRMTWSFITYL
jgi:TonB family protein